MATEGLTGHHQDEIKKYLKFFRGKLQLHLDALETDFEDTRTDRLSDEDMYTQTEVGDVMESLCSAIKSSVRSEFQACINMSALLLRQVFVEADNNDMELEFDTSAVEDRSLLEKVQRLKVDAPSSTSEELSFKLAANRKLSKDQRNDFEDEIQRLKKRNKELEEQVKNGATGDVGALQHKINQLQELADEAQVHISQTKQFQQMKKMVTQKNDQIRQLRTRLLQYEPDIDCEDSKQQEFKH